MHLHRVTYGSRGPKVLLLHGLTSNAGSWWRFGADLERAGYAVTAPDLRGHGSTGPGDDYTLHAYAADVLELGTGWHLVVGHSLGGAVALLAQLERPTFAERLVLEDPSLSTDLSSSLVWLLEPFERPITFESVAEQRPGWSRQDLEHKVQALRDCGPEVVRATVELNRGSLIERLSELTVPTLIIAADPALDALVDAGSVLAGAAGNTHVAAQTVFGAGHSIHREAYAEFAGLVWGFLDRDRGGTTTAPPRG